MPIIASQGTGGGPKELPDIDIHNAVCAFVEDIGLQKGFEGKIKHQVILVWELEQKMSDGRPFMLSKRYTLSLGDKATLRHDLESWRGQSFTQEELDGFDLEVLKGKQCRVNVVHKAKQDGSMKAQVQAVMKAAKDIKLPIVATEPPSWIKDEKAKAEVPF